MAEEITLKNLEKKKKSNAARNLKKKLKKLADAGTKKEEGSEENEELKNTEK